VKVRTVRQVAVSDIFTALVVGQVVASDGNSRASACPATSWVRAALRLVQSGARVAAS
jgi:hypothetical protein